VILGDFLKALAQMADPAFWGVILRGVGLAIVLLAGICGAFVLAIPFVVPDSLTIPWIGPVSGIDTALGWASLGLMLVLSVFLMVPVAATFAGLFADDIADAVEARHYPALAPAPRQRWPEALSGALRFLGLVGLVNAVALVAYILSGPAAPLVFWAVNGYLLGREYFTAIAVRRMGPQGAQGLYRQFRGRIWLAGALMAVPLSLPLANLAIPVLGAATFTHMFHRLARLSAARIRT
jgi:CysZ protein